MLKFDKLITNKIAQNIFVWLVFYIILTGSTQGGNTFLVSLYIVLLLAPAVYINNLYILPIIKKNKGLFFIFFFLNIIIFSLISITLINYNTKDNFELIRFVNFIGIMVLAISFGTAIKLARDSFSKKQQEKEAQLQLLKAQLNPHFLFNTLNNLYGLSVLKSDKLPDLMLKLSDLLRYSLYDTKEQFVPLEKEITYLENYISLEKIRLEDKIAINFSKSGSFLNQKIAPMLLIVFVENAFKHLNKEIKSTINIEIISTETSLNFKCKNTFDKSEILKNQIESNKSGIGLQNAKKRLELIYSNNYKLTISKDDTLYTVDLQLNY